MTAITKVSTCSYCGARALMTLNENTRYELSCAACGAPLHELLKLNTAVPAAAPVMLKPPSPPPVSKEKPSREKHEKSDRYERKSRESKYRKNKSRKRKYENRKNRKKGLLYKVREIIDDIVDEIEDFFD